MRLPSILGPGLGVVLGAVPALVLGVVGAAALLPACYSPDLGNGELACGADGTCPSGYVCRVDRCWADPPGPDGDGGPDADTDAGDGSVDAGPDAVGVTPPDQVIVSGGGGRAAGTGRRAILVVGQPVAAPPATGGGRAGAFGLLPTSSLP